MKKKHMIAVCEKGLYPDPGAFVKNIQRVIWAEQIGNFNPIFCRYQGKRCLVRSREGDLSDPFRREGNYLDTLFIEIPCEEGAKNG